VGLDKIVKNRHLCCGFTQGLFIGLEACVKSLVSVSYDFIEGLFIGLKHKLKTCVCPMVLHKDLSCNLKPVSEVR
jgi:hypothetical protein